MRTWTRSTVRVMGCSCALSSRYGNESTQSRTCVGTSVHKRMCSSMRLAPAGQVLWLPLGHRSHWCSVVSLDWEGGLVHPTRIHHEASDISSDTMWAIKRPLLGLGKDIYSGWS